MATTYFVRLRQTAQLFVGPLALIAFFGDWVDGSGILAGHRFSGFDIVAFTGRLQVLELSAWQWVALIGVRLAVLGVAVAAAWQVVLGLAGRRERVYLASGWYIAGTAAAVAAASLYQGGPAMPWGALVLVLAGLCFVVGAWPGTAAAPLGRAA